MAALDGTVTLRTAEYRPCQVNGRDALFHRWTENEQVLLKFDNMTRPEIRKMVYDTFVGTHTVPSGVSTEAIKLTMAIVEFEGGDIEEVAPAEVKFLDTGTLFFEKEMFFRKDKDNG